MISHYGQYISERLGKSLIEDENGFATYFMVNDVCYIEDVYVIPEKRKTGIVFAYADKIVEEAKAKGMKVLIGTVKPSAAGSTVSLKVLLAYGFQLESAVEDFIFFKKSLEA